MNYNNNTSESEIAGGHVNARMAVELRIMLMKMGHSQPKTRLELDTTTAFGMLTKQLVPKRSKAIDMRFFWLRDRTNQQQFHSHWNRDTKLHKCTINTSVLYVSRLMYRSSNANIDTNRKH